jgi:hypothetical protein
MFFIKIYLLKLYTFFSTYFEKIFFLKKQVQSKFLLTGFKRLKLKNNSSLNKEDIFEKTIEDNKYFHRNIIKKNSINYLLQFIFIQNEIFQYIRKVTGYNFSIDFILAYTTLNIEEENRQKAIYANHWHRDKPYSKNTLKLIMPVSTINNNCGPMEILSEKQSQIYNDYEISNLNINETFKLTGSPEDVFIFRPNVCYHRAGNPEFGTTRTQIMLQLNPSRIWKFSEKLYEKQFKLEPKFPLLSFFEKKIELNIQ